MAAIFLIFAENMSFITCHTGYISWEGKYIHIYHPVQCILGNQKFYTLPIHKKHLIRHFSLEMKPFQ